MKFKGMFLIVLLSLVSCSTTKKFTPVFPDDEVTRTSQTNKIKFFLNDMREKQENQESLFTGMRLSLNLKYKQSFHWVDAEDVPEEGLYIQMNIKNFEGTQKNMYWTGKVVLEIVTVDKRDATKIKELTQLFESTNKKFNFAGEETQFEVLEKSWTQVSKDILAYLDKVIYLNGLPK